MPVPVSQRGSSTTVVGRPGVALVPVWDSAVRTHLPDVEVDAAVGLAVGALPGQGPWPLIGRPADGAAELAARLAARDPLDQRVDRLLAVLRGRAPEDGLVLHRGRPDHVATSLLGRAEAATRDPRAWVRFEALRAEVVDGPPSPAAAAAMLSLLSSLLASPHPGLVEILPVLPDHWYGEPARVDGLPLPGGGRASWMLDWSSDWPTLEWAVSRPATSVAAPGLASEWMDDRPRGSAWLAPGDRE